MKRLMMQFSGILSGHTVNYGVMGTPTFLKDSNGDELFVGDSVRIESPSGAETYNFVVFPDSHNHAYIMGMGITGFMPDGYKTYKVKSFEDFNVHEYIESIVVVSEEDVKFTSAELTMHVNQVERALRRVDSKEQLIGLLKSKLNELGN